MSSNFDFVQVFLMQLIVENEDEKEADEEGLDNKNYLKIWKKWTIENQKKALYLDLNIFKNIIEKSGGDLLKDSTNFFKKGGFDAYKSLVMGETPDFDESYNMTYLKSALETYCEIYQDLNLWSFLQDNFDCLQDPYKPFFFYEHSGKRICTIMFYNDSDVEKKLKGIHFFTKAAKLNMIKMLKHWEFADEQKNTTVATVNQITSTPTSPTPYDNSMNSNTFIELVTNNYIRIKSSSEYIYSYSLQIEDPKGEIHPFDGRTSPC